MISGYLGGPTQTEIADYANRLYPGSPLYKSEAYSSANSKAGTYGLNYGPGYFYSGSDASASSSVTEGQYKYNKFTYYLEKKHKLIQILADPIKWTVRVLWPFT